MPDLTADARALVATCLVDLDDRTPQLVLADYLDEHGDPHTAYALRWMARHGKQPAHTTSGWWWMGSATDHDDRYRWSDRPRRMPLTPMWLPRVVGVEMCSRYPLTSRSWLVAVKRLGWALARIRALTEIA